MLDDFDGFLTNSPIYQDVVASAMAKGEAEEKRLEAAASRQRFASALSRLVSIRFPALQALAHQCVEEPKNDHEVLLQLLIAVGLAQTEPEARQQLEARGTEERSRDRTPAIDCCRIGSDRAGGQTAVGSQRPTHLRKKRQRRLPPLPCAATRRGHAHSGDQER
jgi:hypothetical protein